MKSPPPEKRLSDLGDLQQMVVEILWQRGEATVHDVLAEVEARTDRTPAYTTILTVLQKLEKAGWVGHRRDGRTHVYAPRQSREQESASSLRQLVERVFSGDRLLLFRQLIDAESVSPRELEELERLIEEKRRSLDDAS